MNPAHLSPTIRDAVASDVEPMQQIEIDAGQRFAEVGLASIADAEPPSTEELRHSIRLKTCWVAEQSGLAIGYAVIGYATVEIVDNQAHLHQVSVARSLQGKGVGRLLVERTVAWAREQGFATMSLTTFADLAWNGPWYEHLGFAEIEPLAGSELHQIRRIEIAAGLDVQRRIAMRRIL